jgi:hypothetical protein
MTKHELCLFHDRVLQCFHEELVGENVGHGHAQAGLNGRLLVACPCDELFERDDVFSLEVDFADHALVFKTCSEVWTLLAEQRPGKVVDLASFTNVKLDDRGDGMTDTQVRGGRGWSQGLITNLATVRAPWLEAMTGGNWMGIVSWWVVDDQVLVGSQKTSEIPLQDR